MQLGDHEAAITDYSAALDLNERAAFAFYNRGIARDRLDDLPGAVADFTAAALLDSSNADFFHNRGFSLRKLVRVFCRFCTLRVVASSATGPLTAQAPANLRFLPQHPDTVSHKHSIHENDVAA